MDTLGYHLVHPIVETYDMTATAKSNLSDFVETNAVYVGTTIIFIGCTILVGLWWANELDIATNPEMVNDLYDI